MAQPIIRFASAREAHIPLAGLPAAIRAALIARERHGFSAAQLSVDSQWEPDAAFHAEWSRVFPETALALSLASDTEGTVNCQSLDGPALIVDKYLGAKSDACKLEDTATRRAIERAIVRSTGKGSDGLVSQYLNRPVSQWISFQLLRFPAIRPGHLTTVVALVAVAMLGCLLTGSFAGAVIGAILFQTASVLDGVDGEIARATLRTSPKGATLDSLTDAMTNLFFFAGLTWNLYARSEVTGAQAGGLALTLLAIGMALLGWIGKRRDGYVNFDFLKKQLRRKESTSRGLLARLSGRDTYALIFAVLVVCGFATQAMLVFAAIIIGWIITLFATLLLLAVGKQAEGG